MGRGTERSFWDAGNVLYLDLGGDYMNVSTLLKKVIGPYAYNMHFSVCLIYCYKKVNKKLSVQLINAFVDF